MFSSGLPSLTTDLQKKICKLGDPSRTKSQVTRPPGLVAQAIVIEYLVPPVKPFFFQETKEECAIELWTSASEFNLLTKLLQDDRGKDRLVHCLSPLSLMDLKACRLVNRQLNAFILSEVWQW